MSIVALRKLAPVRDVNHGTRARYLQFCNVSLSGDKNCALSLLRKRDPRVVLRVNCRRSGPGWEIRVKESFFMYVNALRPSIVVYVHEIRCNVALNFR